MAEQPAGKPVSLCSHFLNVGCIDDGNRNAADLLAENNVFGTGSYNRIFIILMGIALMSCNKACPQLNALIADRQHFEKLFRGADSTGTNEG